MPSFCRISTTRLESADAPRTLQHEQPRIELSPSTDSSTGIDYFRAVHTATDTAVALRSFTGEVLNDSSRDMASKADYGLEGLSSPRDE